MRDEDDPAQGPESSAVSARAEDEVSSRPRSLSAGRTALFITHRLANARVADQIVVLDKGTVVETGAYETLLRNGSLFAKLHALQEGQADRVDTLRS